MSENPKESERVEMKVEAMRKVYSEMILNTTKEAAFKIMSAEHKADFFNKELEFLRDDYARILLQLNNHFKSQTKEAEAKSLNQQKMIDELEAQLGEAEGIIVDLRFELKQLREKLEIVTNNRRPSNGSMAGSEEHFRECLPQDNALSSSTTPNPPNDKSFELTKSSSFPGKSNLDDTCSGDEDIIQNTEPDLCKNQYSQRKSSTFKTSTLQDIDLNCLVNVPVCSSNYDVRNQNYFSYNKVQVTRTPGRSTGRNAWYREANTSSRSKPRKKYVKLRKQPLRGQLKLCSSLPNKEFVKKPMEAVQMLLDKKLCGEVINRFNYVLPSGELDDMVRDEIDGEEAKEGLSKKNCVASVDVLAGSELVDVPISVAFDNLGQRVGNIRPIKFTFHRRCKKNVNVLCEHDENVVPGKDAVETKLDKLTDVCIVDSNG